MKDVNSIICVFLFTVIIASRNATESIVHCFTQCDYAAISPRRDYLDFVLLLFFGWGEGVCVCGGGGNIFFYKYSDYVLF